MKRLSTALELAGMALVAAAGFVVSVPLGIAAVGLACIAVGYQQGGAS